MKEFVLDLLFKTKEVVRENFTGFYIHGSLAMGGFNPNSSDIDILIVTEDPLKIETKRQLAHLFLARSNSPFPLEVSCLNREQLKLFEHPSPFDFHFSEFWRKRYEEDLALQTFEFLNGEIKKDPDLAAHITIISHRGICIEGKSIVDVFPLIPHSYYTSSIIGDFNDCLENIFDEPVYCTLNLIRGYLYFSEGVISSKQEAGNWGLSSLPKEMFLTLEKVMYNYSHKQDSYQFEENELLLIRNYFAKNVRGLMS
ncbi:MAG: aminoglycoside adenylyltransferase domain-containing protein [Bacillota bacterium]